MSKILEQLKAVPIFNNSVVYSHLPVGEWTDAGRPHEWNIVEEKEDFFVYYDRGYGYLALFHYDSLIAWGKDQIINIEGYPDVMVLEKHTYGVSDYLWAPMRG
ncbi:MAG: hypothetical protein [Bacteriophage sp.]|nr:MAG: hypothetical protein [Bacteriophage sp.]